MIKRSFFALAQPTLEYDPLEPDPKTPEVIQSPDNLILLVNETLKSTKDTLFKKGDRVEKFERIRLYEDSTEYNVSPVAGTVQRIDIFADDFGNTITYLVIKKDKDQDSSSDQQSPAISPDIRSADGLLRNLPGAPPLKKLADPDLKLNTLVVTCTDDDLLCTTQQYLAKTELAHLKEGLGILKSMVSIPKICVAVPESLNIKNEFDSFQTFSISATYPEALPELVLKDHLNIIPVPGQTPEEQGVCFMSAEAVISIAKAYDQKTPVFEKLLTIIGKDGARTRIKATIGTPLRLIFNQLNIHINDMDRIVVGGPMRGSATFSIHHPLQPDMDMIMVQDRDIIPELSDSACVNCGKCVKICPAQIPVNLLVRYLAADQYEEAADGFDLESCIECGLCAYVCTARIPLFQYIRLGKHELSKLRADI
ncbi:MAG: 4Fe-4S dicluster domain-containing protein [Desulfobacteraceae bacterium]|nr:MAG: 4Fe-4S dicluster domain-containing protein [Desulfobacteraceae bacterium]